MTDGGTNKQLERRILLPNNPAKARQKLIKNIEKLVRNSLEYDFWVSYQHSKKHLKCVISGISSVLGGSQIDLHHYPFSLYEITDAALERSLVIIEDKVPVGQDPLEYINTFKVAEYVISLHLKDLIPFVPLLRSYHKLWHDGLLERKEFNPEEIINFDKIDLLINELPALKF